MSLFEIIEAIIEKWSFEKILFVYGISSFLFLVFGLVLGYVKVLDPRKMKFPTLKKILMKLKKLKKKIKPEDRQ